MILEHTFEVNGAKITVRQETGADELIHLPLIRRSSSVSIADLADHEFEGYQRIHRMISQTVRVEGTLPVAIPSPASPPSEIAAFENAILCDPACKQLASAYLTALWQVEQKPEPGLEPPTEENKKKG